MDRHGADTFMFVIGDCGSKPCTLGEHPKYVFRDIRYGSIYLGAGVDACVVVFIVDVTFVSTIVMAF